MKYLGIFFLFITGLCLFQNIRLGWTLSHSSDLSPDSHFLLALVGLTTSIACLLCFLAYSKQTLRESALKEIDTATLSKMQNRYQKITSACIVLIIGIVLSLITGTISHAGRLPLLHAGLGLSLLGVWIYIAWTTVNLPKELN